MLLETGRHGGYLDTLIKGKPRGGGGKKKHTFTTKGKGKVGPGNRGGGKWQTRTLEALVEPGRGNSGP